jgi:hypothetical protein
LYYKCLESGTFHLPKLPDGSVSYSELCLLIEGVEVEVTHRHKRYVRPQEKPPQPLNSQNVKEYFAYSLLKLACQERLHV